MSVPKAKAKIVIEELGIGVDDLVSRFEDICWARGAYVQYAPLDGAEARITMNAHGEKAVITVDPNSTYGTRIRFALAHELGHLELHKKIQSQFNCDKRAFEEWFSKQAAALREIEANEFAAELLLPEEFVKAELTTGKPSFQSLDRIGEKYHTSLMATARRFIEMTPEACAVVAYDDKNIRYHWRSKLFETQGYWVTPGKLDGYTYAYDAANGKTVADRMSSVDVTAWFEVRDYLREETIQEQTRFFPGLNFGMSLLWIDKAALIVR